MDNGLQHGRTTEPELWETLEREAGAASRSHREASAAPQGGPVDFASLIVRADELQAVSEKPEMIFGPYLCAGTQHILAGQTGVGKSTVFYNIAAAIAKGEALWGVECRQRRVLYVDLENGRDGGCRKLEKIWPGFQRDPAAQNLHLLFDHIDIPGGMHRFVEYCHRAGVELVIFDTIRRCFSVRDENDNAEFYARVAPTLDALKARGIATLVLAHPGRNGVGFRGAQAQGDAPDVVMNLTLTDGNHARSTLAITCTKHRLLGLQVPALRLRRIGEDRFEVVDGPVADEGRHPTSPTTEKERCEEFILAALDTAEEGLRYTDLLHPATEARFSESTFKRALTDLAKNAHIVQDGQRYLSDPFRDET